MSPEHIHEKQKDLADGTFVEHWPAWLRWLLFLPAAVVGPLVFVVIQTLFASWYLDLGPNAFYFNMLRGAIYGAGFVLVGATVAPKSQRAIALGLLVVVAMGSVIALLTQLRHFVFNGFLEDMITLGAAAYATYYIFSEANPK
jgi:hypothetical protein